MARKKSATGRTVASNGYVLVWVGQDHHLSDVRGYAYEHRLVAERMIGRRLQPGEIVHHINEDKQDNRPGNLVVVSGNDEHFLHHRENPDLRMPGEPNPTVECACGCGETFKLYDSSGRPRMYVSGHNPPAAPTEEAVLRELESGPLHRQELAARCDKSIMPIATCLSKLKRKGLVKQISRGIWALQE